MNYLHLRARAKSLLLLAMFFIAIQGFQTVRGKDAVDYIDPFIGTGRASKDFPGASTPFGMTKNGELGAWPDEIIARLRHVAFP